MVPQHHYLRSTAFSGPSIYCLAQQAKNCCATSSPQDRYRHRHKHSTDRQTHTHRTDRERQSRRGERGLVISQPMNKQVLSIPTVLLHIYIYKKHDSGLIFTDFTSQCLQCYLLISTLEKAVFSLEHVLLPHSLKYTHLPKNNKNAHIQQNMIQIQTWQ